MTSAHSDVMQQHIIAKLQLQAQQEVDAQGAQAQAAANALAAAAAVNPHSNNGGQLPRREGMPECQYYMKTGECNMARCASGIIQTEDQGRSRIECRLLALCD